MTVTINPQWQAAHRNMIKQASGGLQVKFQRVTGIAPSAIVTPTNGATVTAIVRGYRPDTAGSSSSGYGSREVGGITQGDRQILVMSDELAAAGFPVPLQKNDQAIVLTTGEVLTITQPDSYKRAVAGCIEAFAAGVA